MLTWRHVLYTTTYGADETLILGADIGGTNSNFGFFAVRGTQARLLVSLHVKSQEIDNFAAVVAELLTVARTQYGLSVDRACFAVAGIVPPARDQCKPTNLPFTVSSREIMRATGLSCAVLANDFEVIGHGIPRIAPESIVRVHAGTGLLHGVQTIVGAGTGLGKCALAWDTARKRYMPLPSEGGHGDAAVQDALELELCTFIMQQSGRSGAVSWEELLSGNGIEQMYAFFKSRHPKAYADTAFAHTGPAPDEICNNRHRDEHCNNTYQLYTKLYARCAKNFALDTLSQGGVYIAGGIAANNLPMFKQASFIAEFINCGKHKKLLQQIPIFIITDYNVSLYGAAEYMILEDLCRY